MRRSYALLFIGSAIILFAGAAASAWTGPTGTPPTNNASAPINVSATAQVKNGNIAVNGLVVFGNTLLGGVAGSNAYLNFGGTAGSLGYGLWDNAGTMEYKNSSGGWTAFGNGTSQWTTSGANIYYTSGNVGVDTAAPAYPLDVTGIIHSNSDIISSGISGDGANVRMIGGAYGAFFRNDGANTYLLLTASGSQYGTWNALRPFTVNDVTGAVTMSNGVTVAGGLTANVVNSNNLLLQGDGTNAYIRPTNASSALYLGSSNTNYLQIDSSGNVNVLTTEMNSPKYCIGASCITSWPSGGSGTVGGSGTANYIPRWTTTTALGNSTISDDGTSATANGNFFVAGSEYVTGKLFDNANTAYYLKPSGVSALNNLNLASKLGVLGESATTGYPSGWSGGVHTLDLYAEGTVGTGTGGALNAWINSAGNEYLGGSLNVQNTMNLSGNQLWTGSGTLYLNYSNSGGEVDVGQSGNANNLKVFGAGTFSGNITVNGVNIGQNISTGWYNDPTNLAARYPGSNGNFYVQSASGATDYIVAGAGVGGVLFQTGNVTATNDIYAGAFLYNSDERLKKNIEPLTGNLSKILALQPVSYNWINPALPQSEQIGFIAQAVQKVVPELVYTNASTTMEAIDYARVTPLLVGSVQELNQKIEDQQTQIDTQQQEITQLQTEIQTLINAKQ